MSTSFSVHHNDPASTYNKNLGVAAEGWHPRNTTLQQLSYALIPRIAQSEYRWERIQQLLHIYAETSHV